MNKSEINFKHIYKLNIFQDLFKASNELDEIIKKAVDISGKVNKEIHPVLIDLCKKGWYLNNLITPNDLPDIISCLYKPDNCDLNTLMINHIKSGYKRNKEETLATFIVKAPIFEKGFSSFELKLYGYSILIFLTQTDSICKELTGSRLFGRFSGTNDSKPKPFTNKHYNETSFFSAILQPLSDIGEINKKESDYKVGEFNRHKIIHGDEIDYDNEVNAYKMASLIFYLTTIVSKAKESNDTKS